MKQIWNFPGLSIFFLVQRPFAIRSSHCSKCTHRFRWFKGGFNPDKLLASRTSSPVVHILFKACWGSIYCVSIHTAAHSGKHVLTHNTSLETMWLCSLVAYTECFSRIQNVGILAWTSDFQSEGRNYELTPHLCECMLWCPCLHHHSITHTHTHTHCQICLQLTKSTVLAWQGRFHLAHIWLGSRFHFL